MFLMVSWKTIHCRGWKRRPAVQGVMRRGNRTAPPPRPIPEIRPISLLLRLLVSLSLSRFAPVSGERLTSAPTATNSNLKDFLAASCAASASSLTCDARFRLSASRTPPPPILPSPAAGLSTYPSPAEVSKPCAIELGDTVIKPTIPIPVVW
ncbi:hypothetical protein ABZP36_002359 [Zizania latifolia]